MQSFLRLISSINAKLWHRKPDRLCLYFPIRCTCFVKFTIDKDYYMRKHKLSALFVASILALPGWASISTPNRCMAHLNKMVVNGSLNLNAWKCRIKSDADIATLVAFLDTHHYVKSLDMTDAVPGVSIRPLAANKTLRTLSAFSSIPDDLADFERNTTLRTLTLTGTVSDSDLAAIARNPGLRSLTYAHGYNVTQVFDKAATELANNRTLTHLCLELFSFPKDSMLAIANNTHLTEVCLPKSIDDETAFALAKNHNLHALTLFADKLSHDAVRAIAELPLLETLEIYNVTNYGLRDIAANQHLRNLRLDLPFDTRLKTKTMEAIGNMSNLQSLESYAHLEREGSAALAKPPRLINLTLYNADEIDEAVFEAVGKSRSLQSFVLLTNETYELKYFEALAKSTTIKKLSLINTCGDVTALKKMRSLRSLKIYSCELEKSAVIALAQMPLTLLNIGNTWAKRGEETVFSREAMAALAKNSWLRELYLDGNKRVSDEGVLELAKSKTLSTLFLSGNGISDISARALSKSTTLKILTVENTPQMATEGIKLLEANPNLISLVKSDP